MFPNYVVIINLICFRCIVDGTDPDLSLMLSMGFLMPRVSSVVLALFFAAQV